jgi:hypothetical protein
LNNFTKNIKITYEGELWIIVIEKNL